MRILLNCFFALSILFMVHAPPLAAQSNRSITPISRKAKSIVEAVHSYVSNNPVSLMELQDKLTTDPRFIDHGQKLYVFMHCYDKIKREAICCAQGIRPELIGKNMWNLRTPNGRLLFHEIIRFVEKNGAGWMEYEWLNPFTETIQTKRSYFKGIKLSNEQDAWIGCGFWKGEELLN